MKNDAVLFSHTTMYKELKQTASFVITVDQYRFTGFNHSAVN